MVKSPRGVSCGTVTIASPLAEPAVAVTVVSPFATAVTRPDPLTVATAGFDDDQVNDASVTSFPFVSLAMALSCDPTFLIADACEHTCKLFGIDPPIYRRRVAFFTKDRAFDTSKMSKDLGFECEFSNDSGLEDTLIAYRNMGWI